MTVISNATTFQDVLNLSAVVQQVIKHSGNQLRALLLVCRAFSREFSSNRETQALYLLETCQIRSVEFAVKKGDLQLAKLLLVKGARSAPYRESLLALAGSVGDLEMVQQLCSARSRPDKALTWAAAEGHIHVVDYLLSWLGQHSTCQSFQGAWAVPSPTASLQIPPSLLWPSMPLSNIAGVLEPGAQALVTDPDTDNMEPQARTSCPRAMKLTLDSETLQEALQAACNKGHAAVVSKLLEHGARPEGSSYLLIACRNGHPAVVELLLQRIATSHNGGLPTFVWQSTVAAAQQGHIAVLQVLAQHGAPIDVGVLRAAQQQGQQATCTWLLSNGVAGAAALRHALLTVGFAGLARFLVQTGFSLPDEEVVELARQGTEQTLDGLAISGLPLAALLDWCIAEGDIGLAAAVLGRDLWCCGRLISWYEPVWERLVTSHLAAGNVPAAVAACTTLTGCLLDGIPSNARAATNPWVAPHQLQQAADAAVVLLRRAWCVMLPAAAAAGWSPADAAVGGWSPAALAATPQPVAAVPAAPAAAGQPLAATGAGAVKTAPPAKPPAAAASVQLAALCGVMHLNSGACEPMPMLRAVAWTLLTRRGKEEASDFLSVIGMSTVQALSDTTAASVRYHLERGSYHAAGSCVAQLLASVIECCRQMDEVHSACLSRQDAQSSCSEGGCSHPCGAPGASLYAGTLAAVLTTAAATQPCQAQLLTAAVDSTLATDTLVGDDPVLQLWRLVRSELTAAL